VNPNFYTEWYTDEILSSFFNLILAAMITIRKRGLLSNSDIQEVMSNWSINSDPLYTFIDYLFEPNVSKKQSWYSKAKLMNEYNKWCDDNNIPAHKRKLSMKAFTIALQPHLIMAERKREKLDSYETFTSTHYSQRLSLMSVDLDYHDKLI